LLMKSHYFSGFLIFNCPLYSLNVDKKIVEHSH
ncbi:MAG: hypothetical protein ACJAXH_003352, partial [Colwellia sp.]